jgi:hypothetical protein
VTSSFAAINNVYAKAKGKVYSEVFQGPLMPLFIKAKKPNGRLVPHNRSPSQRQPRERIPG